MTDQVKRDVPYKGHVLAATATPLGGSGDFTAGLWVCRDHARGRDEMKIDSGPNVKAWIHSTAEGAIQHALKVGMKWVDENA